MNDEQNISAKKEKAEENPRLFGSGEDGGREKNSETKTAKRAPQGYGVGHPLLAHETACHCEKAQQRL